MDGHRAVVATSGAGSSNGSLVWLHNSRRLVTRWERHVENFVAMRGCARMCTKRYKVLQMTTTLSVRIDTDTKKRLEALAKRARRSKSFLAAEAIAAFVEAESWQLDEVQAGIAELDAGRGVAHKDVANWLRSWGRKRERKAPRV